MTTLTKKNSLVLEHIMALLAKAAYCRKRPTNENSNPEQVCRLGFNPTKKNEEYKTKLKTVA